MSKSDPSGLPRVALIAGPTASGKSALALALAEAERGTIINADASQVYRDLRILTARPAPEDEARAPHLLYGYRDGAEACSAADWAADARAAVEAVLAEGRLPILVGGTGLYLRTLLDGIAPIPPVDPDIREAVRAMDAATAHAALSREDAAAAATLNPGDTTRNQRALEVIRSSGRSILAWRAEREGGIGGRVRAEVRIVDPPVDLLYARCDARVETMLASGAIDEVKALAARHLDPALPIMRAIGVQPILDHLAGAADAAQTIETIRQQTRNYAKRQRTWFRNQRIGSETSPQI
ncbi:tRNA (adenosine(37)-N6)-dimethylallyltransferase MiaA [Sphingomonas sp. AP4-R1]|uniref:tRNA (adenosine(37)-N6)-dimethylallyltransferase MiaA n=1 Tax=Sphingomonas sp. AP4-R1 TaxID=2735134 RepID=UPI0014932D85|nr:tRNA (adenosine(37)-N6)-dimethylallyltransferase MiaA [Sphingomonas sp. AP4-R1]QJU60353.1 tRNA (adenosine(37)-N6)-dimethylallyltransferase MiaA [Sphingomonas sp. AP4-R1]